MKRGIVFVAAAMTGLNLPAQVQVFDTGVWRDIRVAAQKANGQVTAAGVGQWRAWNWADNWQPTYNPSPWNAWGSGDTQGNPASMETLAHGIVVSLWDQKNGSVTALVHDDSFGARPEFVGLPGPAARTRLFVDAQTNLWLTEAGLNICRGQPGVYHQTPKLIYTITTDNLWPGGNPTNRLPVSMVQDAADRIWLWSDCLLGDDSQGAIHGVLIEDHNIVTNYTTLPGVADGRISVVAPLAPASLWIAVRDRGIYSVNLETLAGSPIAEPEPGAFRRVQDIFAAGDDQYVIAGAPGECLTNGLRSILWRCRGGQWTKLVNGLDASSAQVQPAQRHWCETKDGLWLGAFGLGGWFVPFTTASPQVINWQKNSPFDTIDRWFQLKDGRMLGLQFGRGGILADAALLTPPPAQLPTAKILPTMLPPVRTSDGKVFAVMRGEATLLLEWDGNAWRSHPLPGQLQVQGSCRLTSDSNGRVWLIDPLYNPDPALIPVYLFDPAKDRFERFTNLRTALQAQLTARSPLHFAADGSFTADLSSDGRICFESDGHWRINYFDGHQWRAWNRVNEIMAGQALRSGQESPPFFARDGRLSVVLNDSLWQFDGLSGWKRSGTSPDEALPTSTAKNAVAAPPYFPAADSIVAGDNGIYWAVADHQLYRVGHGLQVPCFAPDEPQPFVDGRRLTGVFTDRYGSAFLRTSVRGVEEFVLVPSPEPPPRVTATLLENDNQGVSLRLAATDPMAHFSWQADGAPWVEGGTNQTLQLEELSRGQHHLAIIAWDDQLRSSTPAEIIVDTHSEPVQLIESWIAQLSDRDFSRREAAVKKLAQHADAALPALRLAREHEADPERQWWLDAALQECK